MVIVGCPALCAADTGQMETADAPDVLWMDITRKPARFTTVSGKMVWRIVVLAGHFPVQSLAKWEISVT